MPLTNVLSGAPSRSWRPRCPRRRRAGRRGRRRPPAPSGGASPRSPCRRCRRRSRSRRSRCSCPRSSRPRCRRRLLPGGLGAGGSISAWLKPEMVGSKNEPKAPSQSDRKPTLIVPPSWRRRRRPPHRRFALVVAASGATRPPARRRATLPAPAACVPSKHLSSRPSVDSASCGPPSGPAVVVVVGVPPPPSSPSQAIAAVLQSPTRPPGDSRTMIRNTSPMIVLKRSGPEDVADLGTPRE